MCKKNLVSKSLGLFLLALSAVTVHAESSPPTPRQETLPTNDVFTEDKLEFDADGIELWDFRRRDRAEKTAEFKHRCYFTVPELQRANLELVASRMGDLDLNQFTVKTVYREENFPGYGTALRCRATVELGKQSKYTISPLYSPIFQGKSSKAECRAFAAAYQNGGNPAFYTHRYMEERAARDVNDVKQCQTTILLVKVKPNWDPSPNCDANDQFKISLIARGLNATEVATTVLPYSNRNGGRELPLLQIGNYTGIIPSSEGENTGNRLPYVKNSQTVFAFDATHSTSMIPWNEIESLADADLSMEITKYYKDEVNNTEILCFTGDSKDLRKCTGRLFYQKEWIGFINPEYFGETTVLSDHRFSDLFPMSHVDDVIRKNIRYDVRTFVPNATLFGLIHDNSTKQGPALKFDVADDTFVKAGATLDLTFACKKR